eukprot:6190322-Alexandrium_andersonii.AAC.1
MARSAALAPLTNGAGVSVFPGATSPLNAMMILVGYPQTRKSQMAKLAKDIVEELDVYVREIAED